MTVRQILLLASGALFISSCSDKNLAQVEKDDMYFTRKDRKELYALNNPPVDDNILVADAQQPATTAPVTPQQEAYYNPTQNPDYIPGYYSAPQDGGSYDPNSDQQYYVEGYNQAQQAVASTAPAVTNNYYYGGYPASSSVWGGSSVSLSFGIGFGYSPFYSPYYSPYYSSYYNPYRGGFYDPWYYSPYYPASYYGCPSPYYGGSNTVIVDNSNFTYADGQYAVTAPRRNRSAGSVTRVTPSTSGLSRASSTVVRTESNGRLASLSTGRTSGTVSRNSSVRYTDSNKSAAGIRTAANGTSRNRPVKHGHHIMTFKVSGIR